MGRGRRALALDPAAYAGGAIVVTTKSSHTKTKLASYPPPPSEARVKKVLIGGCAIFL